jgi:hypothetical protein
LLRSIMRWSIELDYEPNLDTHKIRDIRPDRNLTAKFRAYSAIS